MTTVSVKKKFGVGKVLKLLVTSEFLLFHKVMIIKIVKATKITTIITIDILINFAVIFDFKLSSSFNL